MPIVRGPLKGLDITRLKYKDFKKRSSATKHANLLKKKGYGAKVVTVNKLLGGSGYTVAYGKKGSSARRYR